jgi:hypothetical protein
MHQHRLRRYGAGGAENGDGAAVDWGDGDVLVLAGGRIAGAIVTLPLPELSLENATLTTNCCRSPVDCLVCG